MKMPNNKKESYEYLIDQFGEQTIKDRYSSMEKRALAFIEENKLTEKVALNHNILNVVILDYFADLARMKDFEGIERANKNKITSFMAYWWLRRQPLQLMIDDVNQEELVYINEKFMTTFIAKDFMFLDNKAMNSEKCKKCLKHIYYHLKYRVYTAQTLELMLMAADTGIEIGKNIEIQ